MNRKPIAFVQIFVALLAGCVGEPPKETPADSTSNQPKPTQQKSIVGKTTQDIGKFDPQAGLRVVDSKIQASTPGLAAIESYGPLAQKAAGLGVQQRVQFFQATNGRYPTYDEFMSQIVKNKQTPLRLPVLPGNKRYYYDEANHTLVVVDQTPNEQSTSGR